MKYTVVGGQYVNITYGETDSLHAAKCIATRNEEYWDNWKGFHKPAIYLTENVEKGIYKPEYEYNRYTRKWERWNY